MVLLVGISCSENTDSSGHSLTTVREIDKTSVVVLGTVQDAGYPQIGCTKSCCQNIWGKHSNKLVTSLGLVDPQSGKSWLFEASPDLKFQTKTLSDLSGNIGVLMPEGIFLTHAHIGHYAGLIHLGRESMNAKKVKVFAMPRMSDYLKTNGPWSQLVTLENIDLQKLAADSTIILNSRLKVTPFLVPHRGEFSETVGYRIESNKKRVLFIPDIDKWHMWDRDIISEIQQVDVAFLDATFYQNGEVGNRDMSEIPHPFVEESINLFEQLPASEKAKIHFIHLNHTNPLLNTHSPQRKDVLAKGYDIAEEGFVFEMN